MSHLGVIVEPVTGSESPATGQLPHVVPARDQDVARVVPRRPEGRGQRVLDNPANGYRSWTWESVYASLNSMYFHKNTLFRPPPPKLSFFICEGDFFSRLRLCLLFFNICG